GFISPKTTSIWQTCVCSRAIINMQRRSWLRKFIRVATSSTLSLNAVTDSHELKFCSIERDLRFSDRNLPSSFLAVRTCSAVGDGAVLLLTRSSFTDEISGSAAHTA